MAGNAFRVDFTNQLFLSSHDRIISLTGNVQREKGLDIISWPTRNHPAVVGADRPAGVFDSHICRELIGRLLVVSNRQGKKDDLSESQSSSLQLRRSAMSLKGVRVGMLMVVLGGFMLFATPAQLLAVQSDGYPHYAKATDCVNHVSNPEKLGAAGTKTFILCQGSSGATSWFANVYLRGASTPVCSYGSQSQPYTASSPQTFTCPLNNGTYQAYIYFWVGNSQMMTHLDQYFTVP